ncbi:hypothetical protein JHL17_05790 [Azospirillum sp. YIM B02556]|uniref:ATPase n=1 Tax=Azospirillum endophyticum TaxID=2800326 RepID=A0ABS1F0H4_9PROT|nr:hypothetical protein [Azospirillum endophyticum]MBK1836919.1 hypothetical protein [Azospirillum endophyticum]
MSIDDTEHSLANLDSFGDVAAEDDAVLDYFLSTRAVDVVENGRSFLVLGRKGTGKTAIVRYFTEGRSTTISKSLSLRGYPWNIHAQRIDRGASDIEAYVSSWRFLIAVQLASLVISGNVSGRCAGFLKKFLEDNYGGTEPQLSDVLRPSRLTLSKFSLQPSVMGNQLGGVDLERSTKDHQLGLELNALSTSIIDAVLELAADNNLGSLNLHFDELDQGLSRIDDKRRKMLIGLIIASREIRRESGKIGGKINPVVYLRSDIWDELQFSDKNKVSQTAAFHLGWDKVSLIDLVNERIKAKLGDSAGWESIATPDLMRGSQSKWNHILARTFLRPRDVIQFLNIALSKSKARDEHPIRFTNQDIVDSRDEYSAYLKQELDDEIRQHWPHWDEALQACSALSTLTFDKEDFRREYDKRKSTSNAVPTDEALRLLHRFSVIGYERRSGYGGSSWAFQYTDPEAGWDNTATKFKVHLGLKEYAKLRETRQ